MKKRLLSMLLVLVMMLGILPVTAMADGKETPVPGQVTAIKSLVEDEYGDPQIDEDGCYTIQISVQGNPVESTNASNADVVLVVDNSGSMSSSVGSPCNTSKDEFVSEDYVLGLVKKYTCPNCGAQYWSILGIVECPEYCSGEIGRTVRIDAAKAVGKEFAKSILSSNSGNRMAVIGFAHGSNNGGENDTGAIKVYQSLTDDLNSVDAAINSMDADGGTNYSAALKKAYDELDGQVDKTRPAYVIFISDGAPGLSGESLRDPDWNGTEQADSIRGVATLYTVGIALNGTASEYLKSLASDNKADHYINVIGEDYQSQLQKVLNEWADQINTVPAGTTAQIVDVINLEKFDFVGCSDKFALSDDGKTLTWNIGDIPEDTATVTIKVKPKEGVSGNAIPTNEAVYLTYTDPAGNPVRLDKEIIGDPTVDIAPTTAGYAVEYYYDNVIDATVTVTGSAEIGSAITTYPEKTKDGYALDYVEGLPLVVSAAEADNVIKVYYATDNWNDEDNTTTGGDGIPDKYQALVIYKVAGGTWDGSDAADKAVVFTLKTKDETGVWTDVDPVPVLGETIPDTTNARPDDTHRTPAVWQPAPHGNTKVKAGTTIYTYTFTEKGDPLTFTFDANGGAWENAVSGYTMGTDNKTASKSYFYGEEVEKISTEPVREGYEFAGWYHKNNQDKLTAKWWAFDTSKEFIYSNDTVYAKWNEAEQPPVEQDKKGTLLINLQDEKGAALGDLVTLEITNSYTISTESGAGVDYVIPASVEAYGSKYIYEAVASGELTGNVTKDGQVIVVCLQYTKDDWNDKDDTTTGGDNIPDKYQVCVDYVSENTNKGTVAPVTEIVTITAAGRDAAKGSIEIKGSKATPKENYLFDKWTVAPVMVFTGAAAATLEKQTLGNVEGGQTITFTAHFKDVVKVLTVSKTVDTTSAKVGDKLTYTVVITNSGTVTLKNIKINDELSNGVKLNLVDKGGKVVTEIDELKPGASVKLTAVYKVTFADAGKILYNTVIAKAGDETGSDRSKDTKIQNVIMPVLNKKDHVAYIIGYEDDTVRPENNITRAEVATIFFRLLTDDSRARFWSQTNDFSDVSSSDWFNNAVSTMANAGILTGYPDGTFKPNAPITRAEFAAIAARFSDVSYNGSCSFTDVAKTHWAADEIALAEHLGWITGYPDDTFRPGRNITRAEAMTLINRVLERAVEEDHMHKDMVKWIDNSPSTWYYEDVQEATNSHVYTRLSKKVPGQSFCYEDWTGILKAPDWAALEKSWSDANDR